MENNIETLKANADIARLQRSEVSAELGRVRTELGFAEQAVKILKDQLDQSGLALRLFKETTQEALSEFAGGYLINGDSNYCALNDLMVELELEGLKRSYTVTARVTYEFEVEVEATSDDEAIYVVDNDIYQYANDNVDIGNPDNSEFQVSES